MSQAVMVVGFIANVEQKTSSANGNKFTVCRLRTHTKKEIMYWRVTAFSDAAQEELARVEEGEAVCCQGTPEFSIWQPPGKDARINLSMVADFVRAIRQPKKPPSEKKKYPPRTIERLSQSDEAIDPNLNDNPWAD